MSLPRVTSRRTGSRTTRAGLGAVRVLVVVLAASVLVAANAYATTASNSAPDLSGTSSRCAPNGGHWWTATYYIINTDNVVGTASSFLQTSLDGNYAPGQENTVVHDRLPYGTTSDYLFPPDQDPGDFIAMHWSNASDDIYFPAVHEPTGCAGQPTPPTPSRPPTRSPSPTPPTVRPHPSSAVTTPPVRPEKTATPQPAAHSTASRTPEIASTPGPTVSKTAAAVGTSTATTPGGASQTQHQPGGSSRGPLLIAAICAFGVLAASGIGVVMVRRRRTR